VLNFIIKFKKLRDVYFIMKTIGDLVRFVGRSAMSTLAGAMMYVSMPSRSEAGIITVPITKESMNNNALQIAYDSALDGDVIQFSKGISSIYDMRGKDLVANDDKFVTIDLSTPGIGGIVGDGNSGFYVNATDSRYGLGVQGHGALNIGEGVTITGAASFTQDDVSRSRWFENSAITWNSTGNLTILNSSFVDSSNYSGATIDLQSVTGFIDVQRNSFQEDGIFVRTGTSGNAEILFSQSTFDGANFGIEITERLRDDVTGHIINHIIIEDSLELIIKNPSYLPRSVVVENNNFYDPSLVEDDTLASVEISFLSGSDLSFKAEDYWTNQEIIDKNFFVPNHGVNSVTGIPYAWSPMIDAGYISSKLNSKLLPYYGLAPDVAGGEFIGSRGIPESKALPFYLLVGGFGALALSRRRDRRTGINVYTVEDSGDSAFELEEAYVAD
jgi:hypothetical protein